MDVHTRLTIPSPNISFLILLLSSNSLFIYYTKYNPAQLITCTRRECWLYRIQLYIYITPDLPNVPKSMCLIYRIKLFKCSCHSDLYIRTVIQVYRELNEEGSRINCYDIKKYEHNKMNDIIILQSLISETHTMYSNSKRSSGFTIVLCFTSPIIILDKCCDILNKLEWPREVPVAKDIIFSCEYST